ncbi:MAG: YafY family protein [Sterolibacterium sp.]
MRRADRLFRIVQLLRPRRLTTGAWLAERLEVSSRTVYRDIRDLQLSGVPIVGEAGVGYALSHKLDLPPLLFTQNELDALRFGLRVVQQRADRELAKAAGAALEKIAAALPRERRRALGETSLFVSPDGDYPSESLGPMRLAIRERLKADISYRDAQGTPTERLVWPLGLFYWGKVWTFVAWCELRGQFRDFRVDRVLAFAVAGEHYPEEQGRTLADYIRMIGRDYGVSYPSQWFERPD